MWGGNLNQFGIDGTQLDNSLDTVSMVSSECRNNGPVFHSSVMIYF
jgi:hypothetical protein